MRVVKPLVAGNWKMNGLSAAVEEAVQVNAGLQSMNCSAEVMLCPPATLLAPLITALKGGSVTIGGQDCHANLSGAHTGDISAEMIKDIGASAVIVGHSERRADHGELSRHVCTKAEAAHRAGLQAIVCIGETAGERQSGRTLNVNARQLAASVPDGATADNTVVAYEPVWAIGTGLTPTKDDVAQVHAEIRKHLAERFKDGDAFRILYGGSVKPSNATELMGVANVNGALVGGASLKASDFLGIAQVYA
ncbi:MAG: triose-phosphate isomerase [Pseudomonadota bacterium]